MGEIHGEKLTWAALLAGWVDFARSAVALPDTAEGRAWREAVADIIGLQAVAMALNDADRLDADERALGLDRARILVDGHEKHLVELFGRELLHPQLEELIEDARRGIARVEGLG